MRAVLRVWLFFAVDPEKRTDDQGDQAGHHLYHPHTTSSLPTWAKKVNSTLSKVDSERLLQIHRKAVEQESTQTNHLYYTIKNNKAKMIQLGLC